MKHSGPSGVSSLVRPSLRAIGAYRLRPSPVPAADLVRLHQNEAPADWPDAVKREIAERLVVTPWHRYPSARADGVRQALGRLQGTPPDMIAAAAGSNEALWAAFAAFASGGTVVMPSPTYSMAKPLAIAAGARVVDVPLTSDFDLDAPAVLREADAHHAEVVYLATPNNPTGRAFDPAAVEAVLAGAPGAVVVDEAYWEFASRSWIDAVRRHANLVVVRTFSKAMAGAGIRVGWLTAHESLIEEFAKVLPPYNLNAFAQVAIPILVAHQELALARIRMIETERGRVADAMRARGVHVYPSETNFLLFAAGSAGRAGDAPAMWERIASNGVLVRDVSSVPGLEGCLRVSIGEPADNDRFLHALGLGAGRRTVVRARTPRKPDAGRPRAAAIVERATAETRVRVELEIDGRGAVAADTGVPFFDHMLAAFGRHARFDLRVQARGDIAVDAHHTVEDVGIVLGQAFRQAVGDGAGITRFASLHTAMDDALALIAVDISGRAYLHYAVSYATDRIGAFPVDLVEEFLRAFATHAGITLHVRLEHGRNSHHVAEAVFKGTGIVLGRAVAVTTTGVPSTKGVL